MSKALTNLKLAVAASALNDAISKNLGAPLAPPSFDIIDVVESVVGLDKQVIDLTLVLDNKKVEPLSGFLVEVYLSGSDGKLTRLFRQDDLNADGSIGADGFSKFLNLEIDMEE